LTPISGPVEKVIWPARAATAINRIVIIVPISQPAGSINLNLGDVKEAWKLVYQIFNIAIKRQ